MRIVEAGKKIILPGFLIPATVIIVWEMLFWLFGQNSRGLPAPSQIFQAWGDLWARGIIATSVQASVGRVLAGVSLATVVGLIVGILVSFKATLSLTLFNIVGFLRPISPIAWIPIAIYWFGKPAIFVVFIASVYPIIFATAFAIRSIPPETIYTARSFGLSGWRLLRSVVIPAALPTIFSGIGMGVAFGWMSVIAAELAATSQGLGYQIQLSRVTLRPENVFALMLTIGCVGLAMSLALGALGRFLMPWHRESGIGDA